jgi:aspartate/methionine/tyrosine aminotransferase
MPAVAGSVGDDMRPLNTTFSQLGTTVFEAMSRLAAEHDAVNLGQGFPDDRGPEDVLRAAADALTGGSNQYPSMLGLPLLRQAIAEHEQRFYGLAFDPISEVMVTSGATEALAACLFALLEPGDEAILLQPAYDAYAPLVRRAGGTPRFVTLQPPDWHFDPDALAAAFNDRTKLIVLNHPHNPTGKVFSRAELELIAGLVERHDAYAVCDEVYEHIVFGGARHVPFISLPGMRPRSLKIGSAGKTFSLTGWKVGMVVGPPELVKPVSKAHQFLAFTTPPNLQTAVAFGLGKSDAYFAGLASELERRRDRLAGGLRAIGLDVLHAGGTYFSTLDITRLGFGADDVEFCRRLVVEVGVAAIPISVFYEVEPVRNLVRLCFAKQDAVIDRALERLRAQFARG